MIETVNVYGTNPDKSRVSVFYHGVSFMYFDSFHTTFYSPTSTTTKIQIAYIFSKDDGIIIELGCSRGHSQKYFNCSFLSAFGNEDERLFIQPYWKKKYLQTLSIRNMSTNENYKDHIQALSLLQRLTSNDRSLQPEEYGSEVMITLNDMIECITTTQKKSLHSSDYVTYIITKFIENPYKDNLIRIHIPTFKRFRNKIDSLCHPSNEDIVFMDKLNVMFRWIKKISLWDVSCSDVCYWKDFIIILENINKLSFSKLKEIDII